MMDVRARMTIFCTTLPTFHPVKPLCPWLLRIHAGVVREIDDLLCGLAFQRSFLQGQAGFL
jgi:hypothetical protein